MSRLRGNDDERKHTIVRLLVYDERSGCESTLDNVIIIIFVVVVVTCIRLDSLGDMTVRNGFVVVISRVINGFALIGIMNESILWGIII